MTTPLKLQRFSEKYRERDGVIYSYSQLESISSCGEKYRILKMIEDRPDQQPAAWLVHGNAFHAAAERSHTSNSDMRTLYAEAWQEELERQTEVQPDLTKWALTPRVKKTETDLELRFAAGLIQCDAYETEKASGEWEIAEFDGQPAVEVPFQVEFATQFGPVQVRGKIDEVRITKNGTYEIVDLKTGAAQEYKNRQLGLYGMAASEIFQEEIVWGRYWYSKLDTVPRSGDKLGRYSRYVDLRVYNREYWTLEFEMMEQMIRNEIFIPNPGDQCGRCDAAPQCRARVLGF